ncbi:hypothetical protein JOC95_001942 [Bacillus tianshenii]|uniref:Uncharacterized protein n=1 Tax=Sutcliffiella tianshenii TaxID=1463404 RepID=A0ABS2P0X4_9BACI|nr:hypothetical protein [Bacillus tianshenii]
MHQVPRPSMMATQIILRKLFLNKCLFKFKFYIVMDGFLGIRDYSTIFEDILEKEAGEPSPCFVAVIRKPVVTNQ